MFSVFLLFRYYLPLENGYPLNLNELDSPSPKDDLCQVWLKWPTGSGEEVENVKVYRRKDKHSDRRTPGNGRSEKLT
jgi:hypothetical protein